MDIRSLLKRKREKAPSGFKTLPCRIELIEMGLQIVFVTLSLPKWQRRRSGRVLGSHFEFRVLGQWCLVHWVLLAFTSGCMLYESPDYSRLSEDVARGEVVVSAIGQARLVGCWQQEQGLPVQAMDTTNYRVEIRQLEDVAERPLRQEEVCLYEEPN